jgi:AcrR family transcriptional regulator
MTTNVAPPRRGRPRDEAALVASLVRGARDLARQARGPVTIDALVAAAGTSKPRVYRYFQTADATFARVYATILSGFISRLAEALGTPGSISARLAAADAVVREATEEAPILARLALEARHLALHMPVFRTELAGIDDTLRLAVQRVYADGVADGSLPGLHKPEAAAAAIVDLWAGVLTRIAVTAEPSHLAEELEVFRYALAHPTPN